MSNHDHPMTTELRDVPLDVHGGHSIETHVWSLQNRRILPVAALVAKHAFWGIESETNNVGSAVDPSDARTAQIFKATVRRLWERAKKYNKSGSGHLEFTHPIRFPTLLELQAMPNTPKQQLNYLLLDLFKTLLGQQGSRLQTFIDATGIDEIEASIQEVEEFIDTEFGDGTPVDNDPGKFNTGKGMPDYSRLGILSPNPLHGNVVVHEPSSATPPQMPGDVPAPQG